MRALGASAATALLGGCASLAAGGARFDASRISVAPTVLVATTRKAVNGGRAKPWYGAERGSLSLARAKLMSPSDDRFSFSAIGMGDWALESVEPIRGQPGDLIAQAQVRDILVYIHGFRNTFEGSLLDAVRLSDGISFSGETMAFSWPSKAGLFDYAYDRESAMWSRDGFERVLDGVMLSQTRSRLHLVAHSMGTMLTLEALRQIYARYGDAASEKFGAIVFASPDIDIDIFTSSIERLGPLARKITIVTATNDRALALSRKLAGGITRVGAAEKAQLERLGTQRDRCLRPLGHHQSRPVPDQRRGAQGDPRRDRAQRPARLSSGAPVTRVASCVVGDALLHRARALGRARAPVAEIVIAIDRDVALAGLVVIGRRHSTERHLAVGAASVIVVCALLMDRPVRATAAVVRAGLRRASRVRPRLRNT